MAYASNKLFEEKIKLIRGRLCRDVKVTEILPHLPCLTQTDREEVEAKKEQYGNYSAVNLLLDNLRRRENWPEQLINALRECSHPSLADEIEEAYNKIRGIKTASPPAPTPANTEASSASLPSPSPASDPAAVALSQANVSAAASATVTTATIHKPLRNEALVQSSTPHPSVPDQVEVPALVSAPRTPTCPSSEPALSAELLPLASRVIPPSPVSSPQVTYRPEQTEVLVSSATTPALGSLNSQTARSVPTLVAAPSFPNNSVTVSSNQSNNSFTPLQLPNTLEESKVPVGIPENSSSVKYPIQDTCPPEKGTQDLQNSSNRTQTEESVNNSVCYQTEVTSPGTAASTGAAAVSLPRVAVDDDMCLSKPGVLCEEQPHSVESLSSQDLEISHATTGTEGPSSGGPTRAIPVFNPRRVTEIAGPCCSVTSDELMLSNATMHFSATHSENSVHNFTHSESSHLNNGPAEVDSAFSPNEPEESHYESVSQTMQIASDVLEHNIEFSELPSVQNLSQPHTNDQSGSPNLNSKTENRVQSENISTQKRHEIEENNVFASGQTGSAANTSGYGFNASGNNVSSQSEQREEPQGLLNQLQSNSRLIAAAVGVTAIFIAMKLKYQN